jgi:hypothetical protein
MGRLNTTDLQTKLNVWLLNPPDYYDVTEAYTEYGRLRAAIKRKEREISRAEDIITIEIDKPRSNEAKVAKLTATATLRDELSELEAEYAIIEAQIKVLEFMKSMFSAATYSTKVRTDYA